MVKIAVAGADGKMGKMIIEAIFNSQKCELAAALCIPDSPSKGKDAGDFLGQTSGVFITDDLDAISGADCLIDFTRVEGTLKHIEACKKHGCNIVIGTTGFNEQQIDTLQKAGKDIAVMLSPNMSVGVNAVYALLQKAAQLFDESYDIEVIEAHHRNKVDAPSGTAIKLAEVIAAEKDKPLADIAEWTRYGHTGARKTGTIGFSVIRGGDIVGDHTVAFCGPGECIEITHRALNRTIFAQGSLKAALFLANQKSGFFSMQDVIGNS